MNKIAAIIVSTLVFCTAVTPTLADGFYGAIDLGQATGKDLCTGASTFGVTGCQDTSTLNRIGVGYQFAPMWGTEVNLGSGLRSTLGSLGGYEVAGWRLALLLQVSATGTFPISDAFALTGKVGIANIKLKILPGANDITATTTKPAFGIGAQYFFTKSFGVRAQYEDLGTAGDANTTGTSKFTLLSAGIVFRF